MSASEPGAVSGTAAGGGLIATLVPAGTETIGGFAAAPVSSEPSAGCAGCEAGIDVVTIVLVGTAGLSGCGATIVCAGAGAGGGATRTLGGGGLTVLVCVCAG